MLRTLQASALSLALALGIALPKPAVAGEQDIARAILGALTLYAIGDAIGKARADNRRDPAPVYTPPRHDNDWRYRHGDDHDKDRWKSNYKARAIPAVCAFDRNRPTQRAYIAADCLDRNRVTTRYLPRDCRVTIETRGQRETFYSSRCLQREGYRIEARNRH